MKKFVKKLVKLFLIVIIALVVLIAVIVGGVFLLRGRVNHFSKSYFSDKVWKNHSRQCWRDYTRGSSHGMYRRGYMQEYLIKGFLIALIFGIPAGAIGALTIQRSLKNGFIAGFMK